VQTQHAVTRDRERRSLIRQAVATVVVLSILAFLLSVHHTRQFIKGVDGRKFEVISFSRQSSGRMRWVLLQYETTTSDQNSLQSEIEDILPALTKAIDSLGESKLEITASRPLIRIGDAYSIYHSYTVWLERDGQQWKPVP
jgi:hypothetical protein